MIHNVEFRSEGATLRGRLYAPSDLMKPAPTVVMAHGFSATLTGMVADNYAEAFCDAGFSVLLYDHRNLGLSDGEPRQELNRWIQTRGYGDAIDFAVTRPEVDVERIAVWGDSMSGSEVIVLGAIDERIRAVVAQVPAIGSEPPPLDPDGMIFEALRETVLHGDVRGTPQTTIGPMPVVSFSPAFVPSLLEPITAYRWFIEYGGRYGTGWQNWATRVAPNTPAPFHAALCAPYLQAALLMVIAEDDEMPGAESDIARLTWELAPQPKELIEMDGGHFGLLHYPSALFDQAVGVQTDFLIRHLR